MSDIPVENSESSGLPGWVMTFADLMTLLMCFFVLLLSFSEMDVAKFKQMAGSMEQAFGVQAEIEVKSIPKGTSIIAQEFSPGTPERTVMNEVRQYTVNSNQSSLDVGQRRGPLEEEGKGKGEGEGGGVVDLEVLEGAEKLAEEQAQRLREALSREIAEGSLVIRRTGANVIVQVLERDSFASGSAQLESTFLPTLQTMGRLLSTMKGAIGVAGHTDNVPISTSQYRSNWDLSATRAATVAHELLEAGVAPERVMISGYADTQPRAPNDTAENRALNRRIDITIITNRDHHPSWAEAALETAAGQQAGDAQRTTAAEPASATEAQTTAN